MRYDLILAAMMVLGGPALAQDPDCNNQQTQSDMNQCAQFDWQEADEALNDIYGAAMDQMKATDAYLDESDRGAAIALRDAQRAWIDFRDAACVAEAYPFFGGSMQPMIEMGCLGRLTWARVQDLSMIVDMGN